MIDQAGSTLLQRFSFSYDSVGNRTVVQDSAGAASTYTYDNKNRLTQDNTTGLNAHTYTYDLRHEVARWIVMRSRNRHDRVSHHPYPTRYGGKVTRRLKPSDNVSHLLRAGVRTAKGGRNCQHQGSEGPGWTAWLADANSR